MQTNSVHRHGQNQQKAENTADNIRNKCGDNERLAKLLKSAHHAQERLFGWHNCLFPTERSGMAKIDVGRYPTDKAGPMQVVSGPMGQEKVHYEAPPVERMESEMSRFLTWIESSEEEDPILKAAIAHLWFVTVHPFDDGNGRIGRAVADLCLARADQTAQRFYSMSKQIRDERSEYYDILEKTQKQGLDITDWLEWFLSCLLRAMHGAETTLDSILSKARFWDSLSGTPLNERQSKVQTNSWTSTSYNVQTKRRNQTRPFHM